MIGKLIKIIITIGAALYIVVSVFFLWQFKHDEGLKHCYDIPMERLKTRNWTQTLHDTIDKGEKLVKTGQEMASSAAQMASSAGQLQEGLDSLGEF